MPPARALTLVAVLASSAVMIAQQQPCCFAVLNAAGEVRMTAKFADAPYKRGTVPSVEWGLRPEKNRVVDNNGQVVSAFGFYGWREGSETRVAVIARLAPEGGENRVYLWPELNKAGLKPRYELFATYTVPPDGTRAMDELKALGVEAVALRSESRPPGR